MSTLNRPPSLGTVPDELGVPNDLGLLKEVLITYLQYDKHYVLQASHGLRTASGEFAGLDSDRPLPSRRGDQPWRERTWARLQDLVTVFIKRERSLPYSVRQMEPPIAASRSRQPLAQPLSLFKHSLTSMQPGSPPSSQPPRPLPQPPTLSPPSQQQQQQQQQQPVLPEGQVPPPVPAVANGIPAPSALVPPPHDPTLPPPAEHPMSPPNSTGSGAAPPPQTSPPQPPPPDHLPPGRPHLENGGPPGAASTPAANPAAPLPHRTLRIAVGGETLPAARVAGCAVAGATAPSGLPSSRASSGPPGRTLGSQAFSVSIRPFEAQPSALSRAARPPTFLGGNRPTVEDPLATDGEDEEDEEEENDREEEEDEEEGDQAQQPGAGRRQVPHSQPRRRSEMRWPEAKPLLSGMGRRSRGGGCGGGHGGGSIVVRPPSSWVQRDAAYQEALQRQMLAWRNRRLALSAKHARALSRVLQRRMGKVRVYLEAGGEWSEPLELELWRMVRLGLYVLRSEELEDLALGLAFCLPQQGAEKTPGLLDDLDQLLGWRFWLHLAADLPDLAAKYLSRVQLRDCTRQLTARIAEADGMLPEDLQLPIDRSMAAMRYIHRSQATVAAVAAAAAAAAGDGGRGDSSAGGGSDGDGPGGAVWSSGVSRVVGMSGRRGSVEGGEGPGAEGGWGMAVARSPRAPFLAQLQPRREAVPPGSRPPPPPPSPGRERVETLRVRTLTRSGSSSRARAAAAGSMLRQRELLRRLQRQDTMRRLQQQQRLQQKEEQQQQQQQQELVDWGLEKEAELVVMTMQRSIGNKSQSRLGVVARYFLAANHEGDPRLVEAFHEMKGRARCLKVPIKGIACRDARMFLTSLLGTSLHPSVYSRPVVQAVIGYKWTVCLRWVLLNLVIHLVFTAGFVGLSFFVIYDLNCQTYGCPRAAQPGADPPAAPPAAPLSTPPGIDDDGGANGAGAGGGSEDLLCRRRLLWPAISLYNLIPATVFLVQEVLQFMDSVKRSWSRQWLNILDVLSIGTLATISGLLLSQRCHLNFTAFRILCALEVLLLFLQTLYFLMPFARLGSFVAMLMEVFQDLWPFFTVALLIVAGFVTAFYYLYPGSTFLLNVSYIWVMLFGTIDLQDDIIDDPTEEALYYLLMVLFQITITIVMLNLLIAIVNETYLRVRDHEDWYLQLNRARMVTDVESLITRLTQPNKELEEQYLYVLEELPTYNGDPTREVITSKANKRRLVHGLKAQVGELRAMVGELQRQNAAILEQAQLLHNLHQQQQQQQQGSPLQRVQQRQEERQQGEE